MSGSSRPTESAIGLVSRVGLLVLFVIVSTPPAQALDDKAPKPEIRLKIVRVEKSDKCIMGQLFIGDEMVAYTLERPWEGNLPLISAIPAGRYDAFIRLKSEGDRWRVQLKDVPLSSNMRENVQLHVGNHPADSLGCILVGSTAGKEPCSLVGSEAAHTRLKLAVAAAAARLGKDEAKDDVPIVVVVLDN